MEPDPRFAPLSPEKSYYVGPDVRGQPLPPGGGAIPINVQTQGLPDTFQQMGVLTDDEMGVQYDFFAGFG
jgi:hypothetical protein